MSECTWGRGPQRVRENLRGLERTREDLRGPERGPKCPNISLVLLYTICSRGTISSRRAEVRVMATVLCGVSASGGNLLPTLTLLEFYCTLCQKKGKLNPALGSVICFGLAWSEGDLCHKISIHAIQTVKTAQHLLSAPGTQVPKQAGRQARRLVGFVRGPSSGRPRGNNYRTQPGPQPRTSVGYGEYSTKRILHTT